MADASLIMTADPHFDYLALDELTAAAPDAVRMAELDEGIYLFGDVDFFELAQRWAAAPPIFVRHIVPVMQTVGLSGAEDDLELLATALADNLLDYVDASLPFAVQARLLAKTAYRPFHIMTALADLVAKQSRAPLDVRNPQQVLSLVIATTPPEHSVDVPLVGFLGLSPTALNLSDWAGGMRRFAREADQISRAEFKLLEAFDVFAVALPPRGVALDLGASPGGWTRVLRQREQYVTAVDPGELDPRVAADKGVRLKRMTAEAYLADDPDQFDLIVNDMRMDARESARLMLDYAGQLYPTGQAIMTLKLPEHNRRAIMDEALTILARRYRIVGVKQLFHNRSEVTVFLQLPSRK